LLWFGPLDTDQWAVTDDGTAWAAGDQDFKLARIQQERLRDLLAMQPPAPGGLGPTWLLRLRHRGWW
jgi:hypothetical protein